jgi:hypothetical protein
MASDSEQDISAASDCDVEEGWSDGEMMDCAPPVTAAAATTAGATNSTAVQPTADQVRQLGQFGTLDGQVIWYAVGTGLQVHVVGQRTGLEVTTLTVPANTGRGGYVRTCGPLTSVQVGLCVVLLDATCHVP